MKISIYIHDKEYVFFDKKRASNFIKEEKIKYKILKNIVFFELENWLWKPVCNDKLEGINPRISIKELKLKN